MEDREIKAVLDYNQLLLDMFEDKQIESDSRMRHWNDVSDQCEKANDRLEELTFEYAQLKNNFNELKNEAIISQLGPLQKENDELKERILALENVLNLFEAGTEELNNSNEKIKEEIGFITRDRNRAIDRYENLFSKLKELEEKYAAVTKWNNNLIDGNGALRKKNKELQIQLLEPTMNHGYPGFDFEAAGKIMEDEFAEVAEEELPKGITAESLYSGSVDNLRIIDAEESAIIKQAIQDIDKAQEKDRVTLVSGDTVGYDDLNRGTATVATIEITPQSQYVFADGSSSNIKLEAGPGGIGFSVKRNPNGVVVSESEENYTPGSKYANDEGILVGFNGDVPITSLGACGSGGSGKNKETENE